VAPSIRKKLALTSSTSGGRSVGIVRSRTHATDLVFLDVNYRLYNLNYTPTTLGGTRLITSRVTRGLPEQKKGG
jgi:hypothetical protein